MNPMQTDCPLRIFMLSVLLGMACLTVPWPALATGLGVLTAHFLRWGLLAPASTWPPPATYATALPDPLTA